MERVFKKFSGHTKKQLEFWKFLVDGERIPKSLGTVQDVTCFFFQIQTKDITLTKTTRVSLPFSGRIWLVIRLGLNEFIETMKTFSLFFWFGKNLFLAKKDEFTDLQLYFFCKRCNKT